ncbi:MAG TPA: hypothetical protein VHA06_10150 [Candidatus Angelobacter sp.]|nr:hypothetical protein [Candidatus Angelobacter sp.]
MLPPKNNPSGPRWDWEFQCREQRWRVPFRAFSINEVTAIYTTAIPSLHGKNPPYY